MVDMAPPPPPSDLASDTIGDGALLGRDDLAALSIAAGLIGGCVLLGVTVNWASGLGLFLALLVCWGTVTLRAARTAPPPPPAA